MTEFADHRVGEIGAFSMMTTTTLLLLGLCQ